MIRSSVGYSDNMQPVEGRVQPVETRLRVRYAETDQMGVVYYANYLIWMEVGRVEFCRSSGLRYRDIEAGDLIVEARHARTGVAEATGRNIATGYTKHIWCGRD